MTAPVPAASLLPQHAALIESSGISAEVAAARGYRTATKKCEMRHLGFGAAQASVPALLIPIYNVVGEVVLYQIRPDVPRVKDGKALKYETPLKARMALDVPPGVRGLLGNPVIRLFVTEGVRKADSAVSRGLCCVALLGVWNWRGSNKDGDKVAFPDWESVALNGRQTYIVFDSDVMLKPDVSGSRLKAFLESRGAKVAVVYLPPGEGASKIGMDDYFAAGHGVDDLLALATPTLRPLPDEKGQRQQQGPLENIERLRAAAAPALRHLRPLELFEESCRAMGLGGNLALATTVYFAATTRVIGRKKRLQAHTSVGARATLSSLSGPTSIATAARITASATGCRTAGCWSRSTTASRPSSEWRGLDRGGSDDRLGRSRHHPGLGLRWPARYHGGSGPPHPRDQGRAARPPGSPSRRAQAARDPPGHGAH